MAEKIRVPKWITFRVQLKDEKVKKGEEEYVYLPTMISIYHPNKNSGIRYMNNEIKYVENYTIEVKGNTIYETMRFDNCDYTQETILDDNGEIISCELISDEECITYKRGEKLPGNADLTLIDKKTCIYSTIKQRYYIYYMSPDDYTLDKVIIIQP